jgi:hypothetical protein
MEGNLKLAALQGLSLTAQQWREVEQELSTYLKQHQITAAEYMAAMNEIKHLRSGQPTAAR